MPRVPAEAETGAPSLSYGSEVDLNSRYVWRGLASSDGAVVQPSAWGSAAGFTLSVWSNLPVAGDRDPARFDELDLALSYAGSWNELAVEPSLQLYTYPNQEDAPATAELGLLISHPLGSFAGFASQSLDLAGYAGAYSVEAGISYARDLAADFVLESCVSVGWSSSRFNEAYVGVPESGFGAATGGAALTYTSPSALYLRPHVELSTILDAGLRDQVPSPTLLTVGLAVGMEF